MPRIPPALIEDLVDAGSREHYADAALYDYEYRRRRADVAFYRELAKKRLGDPAKAKPGAARILELGAGSGRVTIALARAGYEVVAIDASPAMLSKLRSRVAALPQAVARRITVVQGDLRDFKLKDEKFPLAVAVFNVLEHLYTRVEVDACLRQVVQHLAPGGAFAFDVQLPDLAWLIRDPMKRWARTRFTDPTSGRAMLYSTNHDYDPVAQIALIRLYYEPADGKGPTKIVKLSQRKFYPAELEALVAHAGLRMVQRYGDFGWEPLSPTSESQVLVCELAIPPRSRTHLASFSRRGGKVPG
ncbi:MAG TPA: methyltransferase domain-containing protein [Kofleriaceae bacterium]|jgi:SAM-dependent methyltransferase|nr:methyltransferase domain-containing protein [Kofleriaceae bacterium]